MTDLLTPCSTTVLAFVKSEGKSTKDSPKSIVPSERAPLINSTKVSGGNNSLSGSLMDKLVSGWSLKILSVCTCMWSHDVMCMCVYMCSCC